MVGNFRHRLVRLFMKLIMFLNDIYCLLSSFIPEFETIKFRRITGQMLCMNCSFVFRQILKCIGLYFIFGDASYAFLVGGKSW